MNFSLAGPLDKQKLNSNAPSRRAMAFGENPRLVLNGQARSGKVKSEHSIHQERFISGVISMPG
ncbi:hypothetical protein JXA32_00825 [Candidatus Sumerlaeota bacterium]|nr:hypothetical protein [Candidatus Sumerlaeota bacterium]